MKYSLLVSEAVKEITDKKKKADSLYAAQLEEAYRSSAELKSIDMQIARLGGTAAMLALSGDTKKIAEAAKESKLLQKKKQDILDALGIKEPERSCKKCGDTAYAGGKLCECAKKIIAVKNTATINMNARLEDYRFDNFDLSFYSDKPDSNGVVPRKNMKNVFDMAKKYAQNFGENSPSILFTGGVGLGKTHLSLAIAREVAKSGANVIYSSAGNLFTEIEKEHFSYSGETEKNDEVLSCDLLIIDDLGTEFATSFTQSVFYNIVNTRLLDGLPTIINTNLSFGEIEQRYSARISSRFAGGYEMIKFFGNDIRVQKTLMKK